MNEDAADAEALQALLGPSARFCHRALDATAGVAVAPLVDHHVHLQRVDQHALPARGIAAVVDLGGDPTVLARRSAGGLPAVAYAGAFLTVPGGYPSFRPWAPAQMVRIVTSASPAPGVRGGARTAVDEMADAGATVVKIALDAAAGPVFDAATLRAVVTAAHSRGLPAVAHAAGPGAMQLALDAGVDALAHAPYTERLADALIARAVGMGQLWISTITAHGGPARPDGAEAGPTLAERVAADNAAAFVAAGGHVLYGTDMTDTHPQGVNERELRTLHDAGLQGPRLIATLTAPWPLTGTDDAVATFVVGPPPADAAGIPHWLAGARVVPAEEVVGDDH